MYNYTWIYNDNYSFFASYYYFLSFLPFLPFLPLKVNFNDLTYFSSSFSFKRVGKIK